jgi:SAM-dependent methyltransferase
LPAGSAGFVRVQQRVWQEFSRQLPRGGRVLDIATGDGRVMGWMVKSRRDLKLLGVDLAPQLPEPPRGTKLRTGVAMENLPFPDGRFAAVTSQFGFEYGTTAQSARQICRVIAPGGFVGLMTHRKDGPILAQNLSRRDQILWALNDRDLIKIAKNSLQLRASGLATIPSAIDAAPQEGAVLHGPRSAAWEIAEAIRQTLVLGMRDHPANVARTIDIIAHKANNELGRIASLESACARIAAIDDFDRAIEAGGLTQCSIRPVHESDGGPAFADFRMLVKTR